MSSAPVQAPAVVRTVVLSEHEAPLDTARLPREGALAWIRDGEGLLGWGEVARLEIGGPDRFSQAADWWSDLCAGLGPAGPGLPGPVAFGSFSFAPDETSVLVVPRVVIGSRNGTSWLTTIGDPAPAFATEPVQAPHSIAWADGAVSAAGYLSGVAEAVRLIRSGAARKVVLAQDLLAHADAPIDPRHLLRRLAGSFPDCWTYAVDGLVGSTPEMLLERHGSAVHSRVLAGTAWRHHASEDEARIRAELLASAKDREEHEYAVRSASEALAPYCSALSVPAEPVVLGLSNVAHLSTDVTGQLCQPISALELAGVLHPTAAVCGTPTGTAGRLIQQIEGVDRGRYAGPVGWVDADGDGEWGIALRCAALDGNSARLYAGCGIVADSDPETELAEAQAKFVAMRDALEPP